MSVNAAGLGWEGPSSDPTPHVRIPHAGLDPIILTPPAPPRMASRFPYGAPQAKPHGMAPEVRTAELAIPLHSDWGWKV